MWNRVILLASGIAVGWTLVNLLTAPTREMRSQWVRLALGLGLGLVAIGALAFSSAQAAIASALVFALSALVAYAANAKQVSRVEPSPPSTLPERPPKTSGQPWVILIAAGEPAVYDGPGPWAHHIRALEAAGKPAPHWFLRPWAFARIRQAYQRMGGQSLLSTSVAALAQALEECLYPVARVTDAYLLNKPTVAETLVQAAAQGASAAILLPIGFDEDTVDALREQVTQSRVREVGLPITYLPPVEAAVWTPGAHEQRLQRLLHGQPVPPPAATPPQALEILCARVKLAISTSASMSVTEPAVRQ